MKKYIIGILTLFCSVPLISQTTMQHNSIYKFKVTSLSGDEIDFSNFKGKKILIVNTASKCGYTIQYEGLENLYNAHKGNLVVVGFPANNFGAQEPGSNDEISTFCQQNYGVSFPMAEKVSVKGKDIAPIFAWLTSKAENGVMDVDVKWNFTKFLIDENGQLMASFESKVKPEGQEIATLLKQ